MVWRSAFLVGFFGLTVSDLSRAGEEVKKIKMDVEISGLVQCGGLNYGDVCQYEAVNTANQEAFMLFANRTVSHQDFLFQVGLKLDANVAEISDYAGEGEKGFLLQGINEIYGGNLAEGVMVVAFDVLADQRCELINFSEKIFLCDIVVKQITEGAAKPVKAQLYFYDVKTDTTSADNKSRLRLRRGFRYQGLASKRSHPFDGQHFWLMSLIGHAVAIK